jgi:hypothetical protein
MSSPEQNEWLPSPVRELADRVEASGTRRADSSSAGYLNSATIADGRLVYRTVKQHDFKDLGLDLSALARPSIHGALAMGSSHAPTNVGLKLEATYFEGLNGHTYLNRLPS